MSNFLNAVAGMKHSVIYTDDSGKYFRFSGGTWAWRNYNPGNVEAGEISKKHNQIDVANRFVVFPDSIAGHNALLDVLITKYSNSTIDKMMEHFAPLHENNTKKYKKFLYEVTGQRYVTFANSLDVIPKGEYKGFLIVNQHRYFIGGGSYDWYWVFSPSGKEEGPLGPDVESDQKSFLQSE